MELAEKSVSQFNFNHIHKRFMVIYDLDDMRKVWKQVAREWKKETGEKLPKRFKKYPDTWISLNNWVEEKISKFVDEGGQDIPFYNKADLKQRGWDEKLLQLLYPKPDKMVYLGRGRYAYYYNGLHLQELEDGEDFIEYIHLKLEKKRKRELAKLKKKGDGFGTEFIS